MKRVKQITALVLVLVMAFALTACGDSNSALAQKLIQGNLDEIYLGKYDPDYLKLVDSDEAAAQEIYEGGMEAEAEYFAYYFDISYLTDELKAEIVEMYKEIYSHAKYEVGEATKIDDTTFGVPVKVYPLDIMQLTMDDLEPAIDEFNAPYTAEQIQNMTDEEYQAYDAAWAHMIIDICKENIADMGTMEEKSLVIQVKKDSDGYWSMYGDDFDQMDSILIYYP